MRVVDDAPIARTGRRRLPTTRDRAAALRGSEAGFGLVEIMAATVILMVVVVSMTNLLLDSLNAALVAKQREAAASIASNIVENARALGQSGLTVTKPPLPTSQPKQVPAAPAWVFSTSPGLGQCSYSVTSDQTVFNVSPVVSQAATSSLDWLTVTVTWSSVPYTYVTTSQVGS